MPCERMPAMIVMNRDTFQKVEELLGKGEEVVITAKTLDKCLPSCKSMLQLASLLKPVLERIDQLETILKSFKTGKESSCVKKAPALPKACKCSHTRSGPKAIKKSSRKA